MKFRVLAKRTYPATGALEITGMARTGQTVTADTSGIADRDGLTAVSYAYQWIHVDGSTETEVGSDSPTYTVAREDVGPGKRIKVKVTFLDDVGLAETRTSPAVSTDTSARGDPVITGAPQVGETISADTSGISDPDGLTNVSYSYQWIRVDGSTETDVGSDAPTYTVVSADRGKEIKVRVSFTDDADFAEARTSAAVMTENAPATGELKVGGRGGSARR